MEAGDVGGDEGEAFSEEVFEFVWEGGDYPRRRAEELSYGGCAVLGFDELRDNLGAGAACANDDYVFVFDGEVGIPASSVDDVALEAVHAGNVEARFGFDETSNSRGDDFGTDGLSCENSRVGTVGFLVCLAFAGGHVSYAWSKVIENNLPFSVLFDPDHALDTGIQLDLIQDLEPFTNVVEVTADFLAAGKWSGPMLILMPGERVHYSRAINGSVFHRSQVSLVGWHTRRRQCQDTCWRAMSHQWPTCARRF